jgi:ClpP class serine protease
MKRNEDRTTPRVFCDGSRRAQPLAIHPDAIGVSYPPRKTEHIADVKDGVAVLSIDGPLEHKGGGWWCFWQTYEDLTASFNALCNDDEVKSIVLKFDSPGGEVSGLNETVAIMQRMKADAGKPVVAYVDEACYSAAYALAMVADKIYLPESGGVGSIGVITTMVDVVEADKKAGLNVHVLATGSKKTDNHPHFPLSDGALKRARKGIDRLARSFFELVSSVRGLTTEAIAGYQAGTFQGRLAVKAGLADEIISLPDLLTLMSQSASSSNSKPTDRSAEKGSKMDQVVEAARKLADANAAMGKAKTDADRAVCAARVVSAENHLAKVKRMKTKDTTTHTEEVDDGENASEGASESESSSSGSSESSASESASESSSASSVSGSSESAEEGKYKGDDAKSGLYTKDRLLRLCRQIIGSPTSGPGKKSIEEVMGALHATWQAGKQHVKLAEKVKRLEASAERDRVKALIDKGVRAGKIAPAQREWAEKQTPASLKAYLDAAPRLVHTEEHTEARIEGAGVGGVTAEMAKIWKKQGFTAEDFPRLVAKLNASKTNGAS